MIKKKIFIIGIDGKMGSEICRLVEQKFSNEYEVDGVGRLDKVDPHEDPQTLCKNLQKSDVLLDFSHFSNTILLLNLLKSKSIAKVSVLIGTTGHPESEVVNWTTFAAQSGSRIIFAPNTSLGILAMKKATTVLAELLHPDFSTVVVETHHKQKVDSPSGTARFLLKTLAESSQVISIRAGGVFGEHEVRFIGQNEEVVISHRAFNRTLFAEGALNLASRLFDSQKIGVFSSENF